MTFEPIKITKKIKKTGEVYYTTDKYCPNCEKLEGETTRLEYSVAGEVLTCPICDYSDWRPIIEGDECVGFDPNAPSAPEPNAPKPLPPLQKLPSVAPSIEVDDEPPEPSPLERVSSEDVLKFDESLIQASTLFERVYRYVLRNDVPPQFAFAGALSTIASVIGDRLLVEYGDGEIVKPNDYFVLLASSGGGKSTAINPIQTLLKKLERRIQHGGEPNQFLFTSSSTERGLIDQMREASDTEREAGIKKQPQRSGLVVADEITSIFSEMNAMHSTKLDSLILKLWDGNEMSFATSKRLDGRYTVPSSALSIIGASTQTKFRESLPKTAFSDGLLARLNFIHCGRRSKPRRTIGELANDKPSKTESDGLVDALIALFQFVSNAPKIVIPPDAVVVEKAAAHRWFEEQEKFSDNEAVDAYFNRILKRMWKYAIILAACRAFKIQETNIVIDAEIIQHAVRIADYFKLQFIFFVKRNGGQSEKGLDTIGKIKVKILDLLSTKFKDGATCRELARYTHAGNENLQTAIAELIDNRSIILKTDEYRGRQVERYRLHENSASQHTTLATLATLATHSLENSKINESETTPKHETENQCVANLCVASNASQMQDSAVNASQPEPLPAPEEVPTETDLIERVLSELPSGAIFTGKDIRNALERYCNGKSDEIGRRLFPKHLVRLGKSDKFIHRDNAKRPPAFRGLVDDGGGIIPSDAEPF